MASPISHLDNFGTNLTSVTSAGATTSPVNSVPSVAAPFYVAFDATNINGHYEMKKITSKTATNILHAATSYDHTTAEEVRIVNPAIEFDAIYQPPQGYLINGKLSVTDAAGITVAIKTLAGTDPSVTDPVYVRIGDTVRTISAALSVAKADGTNWMNAGSAELATKEIDYFVYLGYNATDGVVLGFSRIVANSYGEFSATTTNEKYCAISTITNAASTDYYEVVGRFAATLSAGAGYTWSVPTYTAINLIQRPIYETRWLDWVPTLVVSGGTAPTYTATFQNKYKISGNSLYFNSTWSNASGGTAGAGANRLYALLPFGNAQYVIDRSQVGFGFSYESTGTVSIIQGWQDTITGSNNLSFSTASGAGLAGQDQSSTLRYLTVQGFYQI